MEKSVEHLEKYINTDFRIVVDLRNKYKSAKRKENRHLIGRRGLETLLGRDLYIKTIKRAYKGKTQKITIKLRRGIDIIFYLK